MKVSDVAITIAAILILRKVTREFLNIWRGQL